MGEVWLAYDEELDDRPVAIKVMRTQMLADREGVARFQREMRLASRMQHPNIMTIYTTGADNGVPFMVMEYLEGSDLSKSPPDRSVGRAARIGRDTCAALAYAHGQGVVHRDIKPGNLFECDSGVVKVTDFGIAKAVSGTRLSATGVVVGSLSYIAPEQWLGEPAAFSNDIWAVGCVLYELLSGTVPRSYATPIEYVTAAARRERVTPLAMAATVPGWLSDCVMAMLQPDPRDRPTAADCVQLLAGPRAPSGPGQHSAGPGAPSAAPPPAPESRPAKRADRVAPLEAAASTGEAATADRKLNAPAATDPSRPRTAPTDTGGEQPPRLSRRVPSARLALWGVTILAVAGTVTAVTLPSALRTPPTSPSTPATSPRAATSPSASAASASAASAAVAGKILGCMVTDTGGINDLSFNASSWAGMQAAANADQSATVKYEQSTTQSDYTPNINTFIGEHCNIVVTVGFLMGAATEAAANAHPAEKFAIVDCSYTSGCLTGTHESNIDQLVFNVVQNGFLGGYLAAGMTRTGRVATFGGIELPTVTIYMDGFWDGVQYYNSKHGTNVQVLGWNEQTQQGSFTGDFTNQTKGQTLTETFISEGADIIFPIAGNVGLGAAKAVQDADQAAGSQKVNMEWVDTDGCISAPQYCPYFITTVEKGIAAAVKAAVLSAANGTFTGGTYVGTLANGGVLLAPFHDFAGKVPASLQTELMQVSQGIANGSIQTPTKSPV